MPEVKLLVEETHGLYRADTIGGSQGGRALVRLSNGYGEAGSTRPGVYIVARQHPLLPTPPRGDAVTFG